MKEFNKQEYNRLCAEFLGWKETKSCWLTLSSNLNKGFAATKSSDLKFDSDWNWIMEVIEKIEGLDYPHTKYIATISVNIYHKECSLEYSGYESGTFIIVTENTTKEAVVQAIWQFLNFYYGKKDKQ